MSRRPSTASSDTTRTQMTSSLFARADADGVPEESLVSYLVIHEPEPGGVKTRYLMLAREYSTFLSSLLLVRA